MRASAIMVFELLKSNFPGRMTTKRIVRQTELSFSSVRSALLYLYGNGFVERSLGLGLKGHTIYQWYWSGKERV